MDPRTGECNFTRKSGLPISKEAFHNRSAVPKTRAKTKILNPPIWIPPPPTLANYDETNCQPVIFRPCLQNIPVLVSILDNTQGQ
jgi:hypothetical protein